MKKRHLIILIVAILLLIVIALIIVLSLLKPNPDDVGVDELEAWQKMYEKIVDAQAIEQKILITKGEWEQFSSDKTLTATDSGYSVVGSEKKLNDLSADEAYTVTPISYEVNKTTEFAPTLTFKAEYFETGYTVTSVSLKTNVVAGKETAVLGLKEQLSAPTANMTLTLASDGERVTSIAINYTSIGSAVNITLTFTY
ncbi:MAG: hypothetical protein J1F66_02555 [Clostridiales bacterium]|nr:hypothetical protein [Clostridiales bacterium]